MALQLVQRCVRWSDEEWEEITQAAMNWSAVTGEPISVGRYLVVAHEKYARVVQKRLENAKRRKNRKRT